MLGTYRLLLAIFVALSHADVRVLGLNPGVIAVVCFYLISGFVMTSLIQRHYADLNKVMGFYADRLLRILPQYLAMCALTLVWFVWFGKNTAFLQHAPGGFDLFSNLSIVPLNYYMFNGSNTFTLVPPAWSLGAELQFYFLLPLLIFFRLRIVTFVIALVVFVIAACGVINTDNYGYRLLPGVLVFFMLGSFVFESQRHKQRGIRMIMPVCIAVLGLALLLWQFQLLQLPYNRETLIGLVLGLGLLAVLGPLKQREWDNKLGDLSYGVFLNHFLLQWVWFDVPKTPIDYVQYIAACVVLAYCTQRIFEQPVLQWRSKLRQ
jgi:peptidoglycan/LPS O-acetylase OafA/YrhL